MSQGAIPDYPSLISLFNTSIFDIYARRLVREQFLAQFCDEDDQALVDENRMVAEAEDAIKVHVEGYRSKHIWHEAITLIDPFLKKLIQKRVEEYDMEDEEKAIALDHLLMMDFSKLIPSSFITMRPPTSRISA